MGGQPSLSQLPAVLNAGCFNCRLFQLQGLYLPGILTETPHDHYYLVNKFSSNTVLLSVALTIIFGRVVLAALGMSFWLDETVSGWLIADQLTDVIDRAVTYQGQSPLYYVALWCWSRVAGSTEFALRTPSLIAGIIALYFLFQLARGFLAHENALAATAALLILSGFQSALLSARPYTMALAFAAAATWLLTIIIDDEAETHRLRTTMLYSATLAGTFYSHYLLGAIMAAHGLYAIWALGGRGYRRASAARQLLAAWLIAVVAMLPAWPQLAALRGRREDLFFAPFPSLRHLLADLFPAPLLIIVALSALYMLAAAGRPNMLWGEKKLRHCLLLAFTLYLTGPLLFLAYSLLSGNALYVTRYFVWYGLGPALICGCCFEAITSRKARDAMLRMFAVLSILYGVGVRFEEEDWRSAAAAAAVRPDVPVLLYSGLVESKLLPWLADARHSRYLSAPIQYYAVPNTVALLPPSFSATSLEYSRTVVQPLLQRSGSAFLVCLDQRMTQGELTTRTCSALQQSLEMLGYHAESTPTGSVKLIELQRRGSK